MNISIELDRKDGSETKAPNKALIVLKKAYFGCYGKNISTLRNGKEVKISDLSQVYFLGLLENLTA